MSVQRYISGSVQSNTRGGRGPTRSFIDHIDKRRRSAFLVYCQGSFNPPSMEDEMGRFWRGNYPGADYEADACCTGGRVWRGNYPGAEYAADACYRDGCIWSGNYAGADYEADARYRNGKIWLGNYAGADYEADACYRDGKVWIGNYAGADYEAEGCYSGSDSGAAAATFLLLL